MAAYMSTGAGVLTVVRAECLLDLCALRLAVYGSNEAHDKDLSARKVRAAVAQRLSDAGINGLTDTADVISDERECYEDTVRARLEWAHRMVLKAYRKDFAAFPDELAAFEREDLSW